MTDPSNPTFRKLFASRGYLLVTHLCLSYVPCCSTSSRSRASASSPPQLHCRVGLPATFPCVATRRPRPTLTRLLWTFEVLHVICIPQVVFGTSFPTNVQISVNTVFPRPFPKQELNTIESAASLQIVGQDSRNLAVYINMDSFKGVWSPRKTPPKTFALVHYNHVLFDSIPLRPPYRIRPSV